MRPIAFIIDRGRQIPSVEVRLYVINYLRRPLSLIETKVVSLQLTCGMELEKIPQVQEHFLVPPKCCQFIVCRRNLLDSELRALTEQRGRQCASFALIARAQHKNREYRYGPTYSVSIDGWIEGAPA